MDSELRDVITIAPNREHSVAILKGGPVVTGTKLNLIEGVRSSPMPETAVDAVLAQTIAVAEKLIELYDADVAGGEVGATGSARASDAPILADRPPRALLYGRIQSGKTVSMILTSALCLDNGFRVVVVLTTDNVALVKQTANRFKDLDGPRVFAGLKDGSAYEWAGQEDELREAVATDGIVLVCAKNSFNLPEVIRFLQQLDASNYPVLVLDDEADAATPDTTLAARTAAKPNAPQFASRMHRLVIENDMPNEEGFSLGEELPHSLYVQVTATPYVLFMQTETAALRPSNTHLLEPGLGYCGGEVFFGNFDPAATQHSTPIVLVGDNEGTQMKRTAPLGLSRSINYFILSACALAAIQRWPQEGFKHLSHTSHKTDEHEIVAGYISEHLNLVRRTLRGPSTDCANFFSEAYAELRRSIENPPSLEEIIAAAKTAMQQTEVLRINSKVDAPEYGPRLNFLVGGNILGRGLTIEDLLVTYYTREAKTSQMDTVWQHARMYGYRQRYLEYIRIFLPRRLAARFRQIHEAEEALRKSLSADASAKPVLIRVPGASRPTRPNAIEAGAVRALQAGRDQVFPHFMKADQASAMALLDLLKNQGVPVGEQNRQLRATKVPLEAARQLVDMVATVDDDPGLWNSDTIVALLNSFSDKLEDGCVVYVREVEGMPPAEGWWRGRLGGPEIRLLRAASGGNAPSLALLYAGTADSPTAWYPTIVMPPGSPTFVFTAD